MRYVKARIKEEERNLSYQLYVTEALYDLTHRDLELNVRWEDIYRPKKVQIDGDGDEIAARVISAAGLTLAKGR